MSGYPVKITPTGYPVRVTNINDLAGIGYQLICSNRVNIGNKDGITKTFAGMTSRLNFISSENTSKIILIFGNWNSRNALGENPGNCTIKIKAALEYLSPSGLASTENGLRVPVYFSGEEFGEIAPNQILYSDPIEFECLKDVPFFVRTFVGSAGSGYILPTGGFTLGGTGAGSCNNGEGFYDQTFKGTDITYGTQTVNQVTAQSIYGPSAILGYMNVQVPTVGAVGDSIPSGTSDGGYSQIDGGWLMRALSGQLQRTYQYPVTPIVGNVRNGRGGETLNSFINPSNTVYGSGGLKRMILASLASTVISTYGTNDLGNSTLQAIKDNYIKHAKQLIGLNSRVKRFVACTLLPRTTSTDGFRTTVNQTLGATIEADRVGFNTWIRDLGNTGFAAQSGYSDLIYILDICDKVEVNTANSLTMNGGYWICSVNTPLVTGTVGASSTASSINDSVNTFTQDQYKGYVLRFTSGTANNVATTIHANTSNNISIISVSPAPSIGSTYEIIEAYTIDGTHPSSAGSIKIALDVPIANIAK